MNNLTKAAKFTRALAFVADGHTDVQVSSGIDMKGFTACAFVVLINGVAGGGSAVVKVQQSEDDAATDAYSDLLGTGQAVTDADDDKLVLVEVVEPLKRYVRCAVQRVAANVGIDGILAIQTGPSDEPVTHDATTVLSSELHCSPAEGTA